MKHSTIQIIRKKSEHRIITICPMKINHKGYLFIRHEWKQSYCA